MQIAYALTSQGSCALWFGASAPTANWLLPIGTRCVSRGWVAGSSPPPSIWAPPPTTTFPGGQNACAPLGESRLRKPERSSARSSPGSAAAGGALASCTLPLSAAIVTSAAAVRDAVLHVLMTLPTSC